MNIPILNQMMDNYSSIFWGATSKMRLAGVIPAGVL